MSETNPKPAKPAPAKPALPWLAKFTTAVKAFIEPINVPAAYQAKFEAERAFELQQLRTERETYLLNLLKTDPEAYFREVGIDM